MIHSRRLLLLALAALLAVAGAGMALATDVASPVPVPVSDPAATATSPTPAITGESDACAATQPAAVSLEKAVVPRDFILCSCELCQHRPNVICRISPTGFSIVCSDYVAVFC